MSIRELAPVPAGAPIDVWRIDLDATDEPAAEQLLDAEELRRAARFAFPKHARRYRQAHVALRRLLALRLGADAAGLRFALGPHGKPKLSGTSESLAFNLSDSEDMALIAIAPAGEIGIDVERLRGIPDAHELAAVHFCAREAGWLAAAVTDDQRDRRFLRMWTRKEACLKAIGTGLSIPSASFDAGLSDHTSTCAGWQPVEIDTPQGLTAVEVVEIDAGADCVAALARVGVAKEPSA